VGQAEGAIHGVVDDQREAVGEDGEESDPGPVGDDPVDPFYQSQRKVEPHHLGAVDGADDGEPLGVGVQQADEAASVLDDLGRVGCVGEAHRSHRNGREGVAEVALSR